MNMFGKRIVVSALAIVLVLSCAGCDPDAAQAIIDQRMDMVTDLAMNWMGYATQFVARIDQLFGVLTP